MAGIKETPRQKMIGMMYLVLTALLALNVSKDILNAFIVVNSSLEKTNENYSEQINDQYAEFEKAKNIDPKKVSVNYNKALEVKKLSEQISNYINEIRNKMIATTEGITMEQADTSTLMYVKQKDNYDIPTFLMIGESEDGSKGLSAELKNKLNTYRDKLYSYIDSKDKDAFHLSINTNDPKSSETNENWEMHNFYHTPLVASVTILSKLKNDVKKAESDVVNYLLKQVSIDDFLFDTISARVIANSNYVLLGEDYNADIFIAAFSKTQNPKISIGDYDLYKKTFKGKYDSISTANGMGKYKVKTTREGIFKYGGEVCLVSPRGEKKIFPFESEYIVARPSMVVSADKMNVFYLGLPNPVSISVPGVPDENVKIQIENCTYTKLSAGKYDVKPTKTGNCKVTVSAIVNGESRVMGTLNYRVLALPKPIPVLGNVTGTGVLKLNNLIADPEVKAKYDDAFVYNAKPTVKSFTLSYYKNGVPISKTINGKYIPQSEIDLIKKLANSSVIYLDEILVVGADNIPHKLYMKTTLLK